MQNTANGIALKTKDDMLRLDAMVMTVQLGIRKLLVSLHITSTVISLEPALQHWQPTLDLQTIPNVQRAPGMCISTAPFQTSGLGSCVDCRYYQDS